MQNYYAARAREYDAIYAKPERQGDLQRVEEWLPSVYIHRTVLEVACGTGYWTRIIAANCKRIVAVDSSLETIEIARSRVPADKVEFIHGDAYALPTHATPLDAAFAGFWWSHVPRSRISEFLRGLHSRLEPGAPVVFIDNRFVPGSSTPICDEDDEGNTYQLRRLGDGSIHRVLKNFPCQRQLVEAVARHAGHVQYREWQHYWALEYRAAAA